jgi:hypothetical protein
MNDVVNKPSSGAFWLSAIGIIGCFLIFVVIVLLASRNLSKTAAADPTANLKPEERLEHNILTPEERKARLTELRAKETQELNAYEWIDRDKGVVRLPIDRAIELTVRDLQQEQQQHRKTPAGAP